jgi:hypothetical protein
MENDTPLLIRDNEFALLRVHPLNCSSHTVLYRRQRAGKER